MSSVSARGDLLVYCPSRDQGMYYVALDISFSRVAWLGLGDLRKSKDTVERCGCGCVVVFTCG